MLDFLTNQHFKTSSLTLVDPNHHLRSSPRIPHLHHHLQCGLKIGLILVYVMNDETQT